MHSIAASGGPWDTTVVVEWTDRATPADGKDYVNSGVHVIRMRWGKVESIHAYLDTQVLVDALTRRAANRIKKEKAPPIRGETPPKESRQSIYFADTTVARAPCGTA